MYVYTPPQGHHTPPPSHGGGWEHGTRDHIYDYMDSHGFPLKPYNIYIYIICFNGNPWESESLGSNLLDPVTILTWLVVSTYPSEKYMTSSDWIIIPTIGENKKIHGSSHHQADRDFFWDYHKIITNGIVTNGIIMDNNGKSHW